MTEHTPPPRGPDLAVLVPLRLRVHQIEPMLTSLRLTTHCTLIVIAVATPGDRPVIDEVERIASTPPWERGLRLELVAPAHAYRGDYARKINHAARIAIDEYDAAWLFTGADDLRFHPGWFEAAMGTTVDRIVHVIGTNDLGSARVMRGEHSTHTLVSSLYVDLHGTIDEPGKVLHEGYPHEFVDDELVATAKHRGVWAHAGDSHVEHLHPAWGKGVTDQLYRAQRRRMDAGRPIFRKRSALWNP